MTYRLQLLGNFVVEPPPAAPPIGKLDRKTRAIIAYLAATGQSHSRQHLIEWFCQGTNDPAGTLRWHLSQIRRKISPNILEITRQTAVLNSSQSECDHNHFQHALEDPARLSTESLADAVALYRGPFLADLQLKNAPEFELWQVGERSHWQRLYEKGAAALIKRLVQQDRYQAAIPVTQDVLGHNPFLETIHAALIWLYAQTGQRVAALQQFAHCEKLLWEELAVPPTAELQTLHAAIEQNRALPPLWTTEPSPTSPRNEISADFVGRESQLKQLHKLWQIGRSVVVVDGAAGNGKTRLMQAFRRQLPAAALRITGSCYESTSAIPYHPWLAVLAEQMQALDPDKLAKLSPYQRQRLGLLLPALAETAVTPNLHHLLQAVVHFLTELDSRPCLLILEDLQWADEASLQLFQFLAQQVNKAVRPIMLAATFRTEEVGENPALLTLLPDLERLATFVRLTLEPFNRSETERLVAQVRPDHSGLIGQNPSLDLLLQATGGNPLYMTEILQELSIAPSLPVDLPVPPSLAALIVRRLQQLPANGRQVIEGLAILDQPAHFDLAQQICARSEEETIAAIEKGLKWRLLKTRQEHQIDFHHELMRAAVLQQISPIRQQRLHRRAAMALSQTKTEPATVAYHWGMAGNKIEESRFALLAAQNAAKLYAHDEAIHFFQRAIPHLKNKNEKLEAMLQLGRLFQRISDWAQSEQILKSGLAEAIPGSSLAARFQIFLGQLYSRQSHYRRALEILDAAYKTCKKNESLDLLAHCVGSMGIVYYFQDDYDRCLACYEEALAITQSLEDEENSAVWLSNIAAVFIDKEDHVRALPILQKAVAFQKRIDHLEQMAVGLGNIGNIFRSMGKYGEAVEQHISVVKMRHEWGDRAGVATNLRDLGVDYAEVGLDGAALTCFRQALTVDIALERRDACGQLLGHIGTLLARRGRRARALDAIKTAVSLLRLTQSRYYLCQFLLKQISLQKKHSPWQQMEALLHEATKLAGGVGQTELIFKTRLLNLKVQAESGNMPLSQAIDLLSTLPGSEEESAAVGYTIWLLDNSQERWRWETAKRLRRLYDQSPQYVFRQRYAELTGEKLPPPELPDPPQLVVPLARSLPPYLQEVQSFLIT